MDTVKVEFTNGKIQESVLNAEVDHPINRWMLRGEEMLDVATDNLDLSWFAKISNIKSITINGIPLDINKIPLDK